LLGGGFEEPRHARRALGMVFLKQKIAAERVLGWFWKPKIRHHLMMPDIG